MIKLLIIFTCLYDSVFLDSDIHLIMLIRVKTLKGNFKDEDTELGIFTPYNLWPTAAFYRSP